MKTVSQPTPCLAAFFEEYCALLQMTHLAWRVWTSSPEELKASHKYRIGRELDSTFKIAMEVACEQYAWLKKYRAYHHQSPRFFHLIELDELTIDDCVEFAVQYCQSDVARMKFAIEYPGESEPHTAWQRLVARDVKSELVGLCAKEHVQYRKVKINEAEVVLLEMDTLLTALQNNSMACMDKVSGHPICTISAFSIPSLDHIVARISERKTNRPNPTHRKKLWLNSTELKVANYIAQHRPTNSISAAKDCNLASETAFRNIVSKLRSLGLPITNCRTAGRYEFDGPIPETDPPIHRNAS